MRRSRARTSTLADNGTLVYQTSAPAEGAVGLVWVDRDGHQEQLAAPVDAWWSYPRISPTGSEWPRIDGLEEGRDIYIWDFERQSLSRLTDDPGQDVFPHLERGREPALFLLESERHPFDLYSLAADGTGEDELVFES